VEAIQERLMSVVEAATATRFAGAVGRVGFGGVEGELRLLHPEKANERGQTKLKSKIR
jgi:hypothetical protein